MTKYFVITDIGSTTTKALLIDSHSYQLLGIKHANTTVEAPLNDVKIGVYNSIKLLEKESGIALLQDGADASNLAFCEGVSYLSSSSAGGGLQILVIGLTLFDSGSSAKRAAYGAGGIILDVFAINDRRSAVEQMMAMKNLRPDIILLCGGTDGGAISSVLRLAEILRIAKPAPKFYTTDKIPAIYAGNQDATEIIKHMISQDFELYTLPNLRPSLTEENLKPTQDKIQELFMENVMERAPGYSQLKESIQSLILPTPVGASKAMGIIGKANPKNIVMFDIGGATTDVFTRIQSHFQRTVSANLGMSYSALNVMKEGEIEELIRLLPQSITEDEIRNYVGNKTLYPTQNPGSMAEYRIEHALAKLALKNAFVQHQSMHYNSGKVGYLDLFKSNGKEKYEAKFEYIANERTYHFYQSDIDLLIGAGGVFAHAQNPDQCLDILISGFEPLGITELAIDRHFISPHLGVLSTVEPTLASHLMQSECLHKLALYIRPIFPNKKKQIPVLKLWIEGYQKSILSDSIEYIPAKEAQKLKIVAEKACMIDGGQREAELSTDLAIIIDTRKDLGAYSPEFDILLKLYEEESAPAIFHNDAQAVHQDFIYEVALPYDGEVLKNTCDKVLPYDDVAVNHYSPPRLFVVNTLNSAHSLSKEQIKESLLVKEGDVIDFDQELRKALPEYGFRMPHYSPVKGKIEFIEYNTGLIVLSEIQKYSTKPVYVNIAEKLMVKPKKAFRYLKKRVGDFVYEGDMLASIMTKGQIYFVKSPTTGQITDFDLFKGVMTLQYKSNPHFYKANVKGEVSFVEEKRLIKIAYKAERLEAAIGWGKASFGTLKYFDTKDEIAVDADTVAALGFTPDWQTLTKLKSKCKAIICPSANEADLVRYLGEEQGVINTGNENLNTAIILLQGFGELPLSAAQEDYLKKNNHKLCMLDPHTRIRAGVVRANINIIE